MRRRASGLALCNRNRQQEAGICARCGKQVCLLIERTRKQDRLFIILPSLPLHLHLYLLLQCHRQLSSRLYIEKSLSSRTTTRKQSARQPLHAMNGFKMGVRVCLAPFHTHIRARYARRPEPTGFAIWLHLGLHCYDLCNSPERRYHYA